MNILDVNTAAAPPALAPLRVSESKKSHAACKEAVVDSVLNILTARLSGKGEFGKELYRGKPRNALATAFLLPMPMAEREGDEEASPIQISSHGLDFQVKNSDSQAEIVVSVRGCAYVRILPNAEDVTSDGLCRPVFPIKSEIKSELNLRIRVLLKELREKLGKGYFKTEEWADGSAAIRKQVYESMGLPFQDMEDATPSTFEDNSDEISVVAQANFILSDEETLSSEDPKEIAADMTVRGSQKLPDEIVTPVPPPQKWMRVELELPSFSFKINDFLDSVENASHNLTSSVAKQLLAWAVDENPLTGGKSWGYRHGTRVMPSNLQDWNQFLDTVRNSQQPPVLPNIRLKWHVQTHVDPLNLNNKNIHIALENWSEEPEQNVFKESEESFFQVSISLEIPAALHVPLTLDRVAPSYRYQQYLLYPALGFNGGVTSAIQNDSIFLHSTWAPRYIQPRIVPTELAEYGLVANIDTLSQADCLPKLLPLLTAYESWLTDVENLSFESGLEASDIELIESERKKFKEDLTAWRKEKEAIKRGLEILEESRKYWNGPGPQLNSKGIPFEAWICMNAAMAEVAKRKGYTDWRLFQLAFILANIPAFATRIPSFHNFYDKETAEYSNASMVLYFATGGGKSEAFLGLLVFVLFLDRQRGKERGVTAMLRYPLRLLTLQQAQRTAKTLAWAEVVRRDRKHTGEPFSLGFWVGSSNTPNRLSDPDLRDGVPTIEETPLAQEPSLKQRQTYRLALERWNKLPSCPFCSSDTALRRFNSIGGALGHVCLNESKEDGCRWNRAHTNVTPLPFYIVDEDIYSFSPSVLLGTVDKMAMLGHSPKTIRKFYGLFGFAPWWDPATGRTHIPDGKEIKEGPGSQYRTQFPSYENGDKRFFDPFPSLMIQDEAHLLDESLGTFAGLFETAFEAALNELSPLMENSQTFEPTGGKRRRLKVIAASATVSDPDRQMRSLYQRDRTIQFPYPGPTLYESFYAKPQEPDNSNFDIERLEVLEKEVEVRNHWARIYQSILTNGRTHTVTMVATLANFHLTITSLFERLKSGIPEQQNAARQELLLHLSSGPLFKQHTRLLTTIHPEELLTLIDLHRIALTYVTNKKGGDQLIDAERMEFEALHKRSGYDNQKLSSELITGAVDASKIQHVVRRAEQKPNVGQPFFELNDTLRSIIATSAVSHGVDVEELNSMFFAGMPSDIAEYIQASSRVGRTHIGFCVLIPTPQRARDRYIIEVHDIFHRFLERMIQPASVDRWAENALQRVFPSFIQTYLCGVRAIQDFSIATEKENVKAYAMTGDILKLLTGNNSLPEKTILANFLKEAFGLKAGFFPDGALYYRDMVASEVNNIAKDLLEPLFKNAQIGHFFEQRNRSASPMTSLRDVDEPGHIVPSGREPNGNRRLDDEVLAKTLRFIRGGVGADNDTSIPKSKDIQ